MTPRQVRDRVADGDHDRHLDHERQPHPATIASGRYRVASTPVVLQEFVAHDLCDENGAVGGKKDREHGVTSG